MKLCPICWTRHGRSLDVSDCLCMPGTTVLTTSKFHEWMGKQVPPLPPKDLSSPIREERVFKQVLRFGDKPVKEKKKR